MIRDKMLIYENYEDIGIKCKACYKRDHDVYKCPEIHYVPRKEFLIKRYLFIRSKEVSKIWKKEKKRENIVKVFTRLYDDRSYQWRD